MKVRNINVAVSVVTGAVCVCELSSVVHRGGGQVGNNSMLRLLTTPRMTKQVLKVVAVVLVCLVHFMVLKGHGRFHGREQRDNVSHDSFDTNV